jgi:hypothetical protein
MDDQPSSTARRLAWHRTLKLRVKPVLTLTLTGVSTSPSATTQTSPSPSSTVAPTCFQSPGKRREEYRKQLHPQTSSPTTSPEAISSRQEQTQNPKQKSMQINKEQKKT